ncbi:uncharacterized protein (TIGR02271 family) [Geodermatophilus normandii]|uniref:Uncharacterized protein (TIGR02271 family) n=1 Tax=Geodermatophilus normandii TaxID=1137989 RepID=A0A317QHT7_9ACTN|nr:PRC and DUF2382 domain-containing protein [Geodermatophilus normandii]PWW22327.1 uncharacterized protein (TIGR02271 family) [Geodermatophilus normandii]
MIGTDTISRVIGQDVYDESGEKIGSASEVYLDDETGQPEWATVRTGLFGTKESFVPLRDADLTNDGLRVRVSKAQVKDAPKIDTDGHLSPQEEQELYRYYGLGFGSGTQTQTTTQTTTDTGTAGTYSMDQDRSQQDLTTAGTGTVGTAGTGTVGTAGTGTAGTAGYTDRDRDGVRDDLETRGAVGHDTSGPTTDSAMTRSEEHLNVGTQRVEAGRARLRKYVVSENVTQTVPVSHEEVRVEREPITDANIGNALDGPAISEEEHEVVLHAERPVVEKEAVPVERVRLDTETVTEQQQVSEEVRREEIEVDGGQTGVAGTTTGTTTGTTGHDDRGLVQKAKDALDRDNDGKIGR